MELKRGACGLSLLIFVRVSGERMYVALAVHGRLKSGKEAEFLAAQEAFSHAMKGFRGFRERHLLKDDVNGVFVSLGIWESREDHEAAGPELRKHMSEEYRAGRAIANFEDEPADVRFLTAVQSVRS